MEEPLLGCPHLASPLMRGGTRVAGVARWCHKQDQPLPPFQGEVWVGYSTLAPCSHADDAWMLRWLHDFRLFQLFGVVSANTIASAA